MVSNTDLQITQNFNLWEFACPWSNRAHVDFLLVYGLQLIRNILWEETGVEHRILIHANGGGYRSNDLQDYIDRKHNQVSRHRFHTQGRAADVRPFAGNRLEDARMIYDAAKKVWVFDNSGIIYYRNSNFVHLDTGDRKYHDII